MGSLNHIPPLQIQPQQQADPLERYGQLLSIQRLANQGDLQKAQIQNAQLETQERQLQVAQAQRDAQDAQTMRQQAPNFVQKDENGKVTGYDSEGYFNSLIGAGVPINKVSAIKMQQAQMSKSLSEAGESAIKLADAKVDNAYNLLEGMRTIAKDPKNGPNMIQGAYQDGLAKLKEMGFQTEQFPQQFSQVGDAGLVDFEAHIGAHKQIINDAKNQSEISKNTAAQKASETETALKQIELDVAKKGGAVPGIPLNVQQANDWLAKHPGKTLSDYVPPAQTIMQGNMLGGGGTGTALDQAAERYSQTGELPQGFSRSPGTTAAIIKRSAELHPDQNVAANKATFAADSAALKKVQGTFDQMTAFENTALKNLDLYVEKVKAIPDLQVRFANVPLRLVTKGMIGEKNYAAMNAARETAATEVAKVLGSSTGAGVLSDTQKKDAQNVLDGNLPLAAALNVVDTLKQDMANRKVGYMSDLDAIRGRLGAKPETPAPPKAAPGGFSWDNLPVYSPPK